MTEKSTNQEIIVGTNEEFLLSFQILHEDGKINFQPTFTNHSHMGSIRQVAVGGKYLVSGGTDELIRIFNIDKKREEGTIMQHQGTIKCLQFYGTSHLFSAGEDNNICIFRKGNWKCEKTLRGHTAAVTSIAIHPTGKMALSVSKDKTLRTWNLVKGRKAYITNIKTIADSVHWSLDGTYYIVVFDTRIDIYDVSTASVTYSAQFQERVNAILFVTNSIIAVGGEEGNIYLYDILKPKQVNQWLAHKNRVKALGKFQSADHHPGSTCLVSASSNGSIKVWKLKDDCLDEEPSVLGERNTSCRIICMAIYTPSIPQTKNKSEQISIKEPELVDDKTNKDSSNEESSSSDDEGLVIVKAKKVKFDHVKRKIIKKYNKSKKLKEV